MIDFTKSHVLDLLKKDKRLDGRGALDYRAISIEKGFTSTAEGSARVRIGNTEVFAGVKLQLEKPYPDTPDSGNLMVNAELLPISSPRFETGAPGIEAIELARVVDRGIREAKAIDVKKLCVTEGEKVWSVGIDVCTINADGNLMDAAALAAMAALQNAKFPAIDENGAVDYRTKTDKSLPLAKEPVSITVWKLGNQFIIDPLEEEEQAADARLSVCTTAEGIICALQKGGQSPLSIEDVEKMVEIGTLKGKEIRKHL